MPDPRAARYLASLVAFCIRTWLLACLLLCAAPAAAQFPKLLEVSGQHTPSATLDDAPGGRVQGTSYEALLNVPVPLTAKAYLVPGILYHSDRATFRGAADGFTPPRTLHALELPILFAHMLPERWLLWLRATPGFAGGFSGSAFRVTGLALATRRFSSELILGGGAVLDYSLGVLLPLPAAFVDWRPRPGLRIEGLLPGYLEAKYGWANRIELGVRGELGGRSYTVSDPRIRERWPCVRGDELGAQAASCPARVAYSTAAVGGVVGLRAFGTAWLSGFVAYTLYRRYELRNDAGQAIGEELSPLPNGFTVRLALSWRLGPY